MEQTLRISSRVQEFLKGTKKLLINGEWVEAASGNTFETLDPSNKKVLAKVSQAGPEDVDRAVKAARQAFENGPWKKMSASERSFFILQDQRSLIQFFQFSA